MSTKIGPLNACSLEILSADNGVIVRSRHVGGSVTVGGADEIAVFNDPREFGLWMNEWLCNTLTRNEAAAGRSRS